MCIHSIPFLFRPHKQGAKYDVWWHKSCKWKWRPHLQGKFGQTYWWSFCLVLLLLLSFGFNHLTTTHTHTHRYGIDWQASVMENCPLGTKVTFVLLPLFLLLQLLSIFSCVCVCVCLTSLFSLRQDLGAAVWRISTGDWVTWHEHSHH